MKDHLLLLVAYAALVGTFFGTLWRDTPRERVRQGLVVGGSLVVGAIAAAWLMAILAPRG